MTKFFEWLSSLLKQFFSYSEKVKSPPKKSEGNLGDLLKLQKGSVEWYRMAFDLCEVDKGYEAAVKSNVDLVLKGRETYERVEKVTGVPWYVIGAVHFKEASCNWLACLHNGERIIGTGKKTTIVPIGRGPFGSWLEAAIDAMNGESLGKTKDWEIGNLLKCLERYNGTGYLNGAGKAENSPYLWARSSINDDKGKYVRDHVFDPEATTQKTTGAGLIIKELEKRGQIVVKR